MTHILIFAKIILKSHVLYRKSEAAELGEGKKRFYAKDKIQAVHRLLRGESLALVSRELGVPASTLASWKKTFLALGASGFSNTTVVIFLFS